jgi:hypothetical protein
MLGGASLAHQIPEGVVQAPHVKKTTQAGPMGQRLLGSQYRHALGGVEPEKRIKGWRPPGLREVRGARAFPPAQI